MIDPLLDELLGAVPAVQLVGPRAAGKTTTARRRAGTVVRLDDPRQAAAFESDPDAALRTLAEPVLLDEWQAVPGVLAAVKRTVDTDPRPGRYIITGSVRANLDGSTWAGTGRIINIAMMPFTQRESNAANGPSFIDQIISDEVPATTSDLDLRDYTSLAVESGFPEAVPLAPALRARWLESYLDQAVTRDAELVEGGRDPERLRRYLDAVAANTAGIVDDKLLYDTAGVSRMTGVAYDQLLRNLFTMEAIPAWSSNRLKRLVSRPKRVMIDAGLAAAALKVTADDVIGDGDLTGRLIETFVCAQLRVDATIATSRPRLYHLREQAGRQEIDLLADLGARGVVAFEIKASAAPRAEAARHLVWLRDRLGPAFVAGVVLHTGPNTYELGDRITARPISSIWV